MTTQVLVVDDEEKIAYLLQQSLLLCFADCAVDVVHSGEEALVSMAGKSPDLIITDFHMPGTVDGLALIGEVRHFDADVPVILMTGYGSPELKARAATLGVNHYIQKPFDIDRLLEIAGQLLSGLEEADR